jgi:enoyl-CoA hydratase/carnithine racemase
MRIERDRGVLTIINTDPPINRMTFEYMDAIESLLAEARDDSSVRALVFTADGEENFSVGMDLKQLRTSAEARGGVDAVLDQRLRVLRSIETLGKPSIATLFGYCLGGGLEMPLACTFRLAASEGAKIGLPEVDLGAVPAWGGSVRLTRCVGPTHALDMMLRARKIDGEHALRIGLVSEIHPVSELKARAHELALELARGPRTAMAGIMNVVDVTLESTLEVALDAERAAVHACRGTADSAEGGRAFLEKRPPVFE